MGCKAWIGHKMRMTMYCISLKKKKKVKKEKMYCILYIGWEELIKILSSAEKIMRGCCLALPGHYVSAMYVLPRAKSQTPKGWGGKDILAHKKKNRRIMYKLG